MSDMNNLKLDKERLLSAMQSGLNVNECTQDELELALSSEDDSFDEFTNTRGTELSQDQIDADAAYDIAALGGKRMIGDLDFTLCLGNVVLLNTIKSPLIDMEKGQDIAYDDICEALYVLFLGKDALKPVMAIAQRIQDLFSLKTLCKDNPVMCREVVAKVEEISKGRVTFTMEAITFYEANFLEADLQSVFDQLFSMITDILKSVDEIPSIGSKKKD